MNMVKGSSTDPIMARSTFAASSGAVDPFNERVASSTIRHPFSLGSRSSA